ncbi:LacI family DNA-binding transcriptional regulator [Flavobacteriaceae bacterium F89]|uniref:LacI family DNA-binding transcriptional regulator n=1 Tax=Cerina litoralis TaxID=2874477 RepID=A0AAE3EQU6_9FLAO|nr:LacI family DNA-binding transcriptional regulator [Cerina litoralis]MCG2459308.1 LacI family DNA-binding transcriptional regulator [Cerina litoralis]
MTKKKYTIKDIAQLAGVSKGTVDRVLHNRGKVSKTSLERVEKVLKETEYCPNPMARNLKKNMEYRVCVLFPDYNLDPYWTPAHKGIEVALSEFRPFGITVEEYLYDPMNKCSFAKKSEEVLKTRPDALVMAPLFHSESIVVVRTCKELMIRLALFNNYIDEFDTENFIGQDLYQTGQVGGGLIDKLTQNGAGIAVVHINEEWHMVQKELGFKDYFRKKGIKPERIITWNFDSSDCQIFKKEVNYFIENNPSVKAIFVTNSKAFLLADVLAELNREIRIVGYDLLEQNVKHLQNGRIDFLLHQNPQRQAYLSVRYLTEHFLYGKRIPSSRMLPIDIITSENSVFYF